MIIRESDGSSADLQEWAFKRAAHWLSLGPVAITALKASRSGDELTIDYGPWNSIGNLLVLIGGPLLMAAVVVAGMFPAVNSGALSWSLAGPIFGGVAMALVAMAIGGPIGLHIKSKKNASVPPILRVTRSEGELWATGADRPAVAIDEAILFSGKTRLHSGGGRSMRYCYSHVVFFADGAEVGSLNTLSVTSGVSTMIHQALRDFGVSVRSVQLEKQYSLVDSDVEDYWRKGERIRR